MIPFGINIGAGATGGASDSYGYSYAYPSAAEVDMAFSQGVRVLRVPVKARRLVDGAFGSPLPTVAVNLIPVLDYALGKGITVILDVHDYASWFDAVPGTYRHMTIEDVPAIVDMWAKCFGKYKGKPRFIPSFMNEPHTVGADIWPINQAWINGMRAAKWLCALVVPGQGYSPLSGYGSSFGAQAAALTDPRANLIFDAHWYFDAGSTGTVFNMAGLTDADLADPVAFEAKVTNIFNTKLAPAFEWARANGKKFLIGETAIPETAVGKAARPIIVKLYEANADVIKYLTWWGYTTFQQYPNYGFGLGMTIKYAPSPIFKAIVAARKAAV